MVDVTLHDITRPLGPDTPVWPGDAAVTYEQTMSHSAGDPVSSTVLRATVHAGTHMDAQCHVVEGGQGAHEVSLHKCLGRATVVDVGDAGAIGVDQLPALSGVQRVLFKTTSSLGDPNHRRASFTALEPTAAEALLRAGVVLVGVDAPSVDPEDSENLPVHHLLLERGVVVIENLWLGEVAAGDYELIVLPLRLMNCDGSPVRAVLRCLEDL